MNTANLHTLFMFIFFTVRSKSETTICLQHRVVPFSTAGVVSSVVNFFSGWDEEEHKRLAGLDYVSILDYPQDHTKDSGYGNAERSYRSQEARRIDYLCCISAFHCSFTLRFFVSVSSVQ